MRFEKVMIGGDPEYFLYDQESGKMHSAIGVYGGSKKDPLYWQEGFGVQEDNVAVEINFPPVPITAPYEFSGNIEASLEYISRIARDKVGRDVILHPGSACVFPASELKHPKAKEFGCDPDYNAWTMEMNPRPSAVNPTLRTAGGHIWVSWKNIQEKQTEILKSTSLIKAMDVFIGIPSLWEDMGGGHRRELYGRAGCFRMKLGEGMAEYRVPSNYWTLQNAYRLKIVERIQQSINFLKNEKDSVEMLDFYGKDIQSVINNGQIAQARKLHSLFER